MFAIVKKELSLFFNTLTAYIVIAVFLLINSLMLWLIPGLYNVLDSGYANLDGMFYFAPWLFLFLIPAIFMKAFAEEKQNDTWDLLANKPISESKIVLAKYLAGMLLILIALIPTLIHFVSVYYFAQPVGNVDTGQIWGSYLGLFMLATIYGTISIFASSISNNQIVSFILAALLIVFMLYGFDLIANIFTSGITAMQISNLGLNAHYKSMSRGVVDSNDLIYFLSVGILFLVATIHRVKRYKW